MNYPWLVAILVLKEVSADRRADHSSEHQDPVAVKRTRPPL
jgi:hypothetical protein